MPVYTYNSSRVKGIEVSEFGRIYDGNGNEIPHKYVFAFCTDTGMVWYYEEEVWEGGIRIMMNHDGTEFLSDSRKYPRPLVFVPLSYKDTDDAADQPVIVG